jgi:hypothetical protein
MTFVISFGAFANSSDTPVLAFAAARDYLANNWPNTRLGNGSFRTPGFIARWTIALGCSTIRCAEDEMLADEFR